MPNKINKAGAQKRQQIYDTAKHLFYEYGYKDTSYVNIKNELNINKGLIPYHFKSKFELGWSIYKETQKETQIILESYITKSKILLALACEYFFEQLIAANKKYARFCYELYSQPEASEYLIEEQYDYLKIFKDELLEPIDDEHFKITALLTSGIDLQIVRGTYLNIIKKDSLDAFRMSIKFLLLELGYSITQIEEYIDIISNIKLNLYMTDDFLIQKK